MSNSVDHLRAPVDLIGAKLQEWSNGFFLQLPNIVAAIVFPVRREHYDIGIGYGDGPAEAAKAFLDAIQGVEGVVADPPPEVLPWELGDNAVTLRARWWTDSLRTHVVHVRSAVILAIFEAAQARGIDLPFPTRVVLFHDQTEETDGDRRRQREGWPAGEDPPQPRRLRAVEHVSDG